MCWRGWATRWDIRHIITHPNASCRSPQSIQDFHHSCLHPPEQDTQIDINGFEPFGYSTHLYCSLETVADVSSYGAYLPDTGSQRLGSGKADEESGSCSSNEKRLQKVSSHGTQRHMVISLGGHIAKASSSRCLVFSEISFITLIFHGRSRVFGKIFFRPAVSGSRIHYPSWTPLALR